MTCNTMTVVFSVSNLLHFIISIGALFLMTTNIAIIVSCLVYGATIVPEILGFHMIQKKYNSLVSVVYVLVVAALNLGTIVALNMLIIMNEVNGLAFMAFIHGFIIPGNAITVSKLIKKS